MALMNRHTISRGDQSPDFTRGKAYEIPVLIPSSEMLVLPIPMVFYCLYATMCQTDQRVADASHIRKHHTQTIHFQANHRGIKHTSALILFCHMS